MLKFSQSVFSLWWGYQASGDKPDINLLDERAVGPGWAVDSHLKPSSSIKYLPSGWVTRSNRITSSYTTNVREITLLTVHVFRKVKH